MSEAWRAAQLFNQPFDDCLNECYLVLIERDIVKRHDSTRGALSTFVVTVVRNHLINVFTTRKRVQVSTDKVMTAQAHESTRPDYQAEFLELLRAVRSKLSTHSRTVFDELFASSDGQTNTSQLLWGEIRVATREVLAGRPYSKMNL